MSHRSPVARAARAVGWDVHVAAPPDHVWAPKGFSVDQIKAAGFEYHPIPLSRRGTNPIAEVRTFLALLRLYRRLRPDLVHHVTMKPNLYGGLAARLVGVPATVHAFTGLGHVFSGRGLRAAALRAIVRLLMRASLAHRNAYVVFQNTDDARQLVNRGIVAPERAHVIRGSGVDLGRFHPQAEPEGIPLVVLASRLIWDKGVGEFVEAARMLRRKGVEARFALVGDTHPTNPRSVPPATLESWEREVPKDKKRDEKNSFISSLSPREIVSELDRYVVGQNKAKRAVAIALRNRWRRQALKGDMKDEVLPKNILMIGPTGVGKTEISRRLSKLAEAPFVKVEATRFTEVGYVGRDVEQIVRDLLEIAIAMEKIKKRKEVFAKAQKLAEERVLDALVGNKASVATRESFRKRLRNGDLDNNEIEIAVTESSNLPSFEIPGMPGANVGMINISDMLGKSMGTKAKKKKMTVKESHEILINEESDKLIEEDNIIKSAKNSTENNGIVFLDEIDKISARTDRVGGDVSREGVQRDLLPLIEGTTVSTKYGPIKTDHILFIASGAFQLAKPSDLLPELQGRLPIRVELEALTSEDFKRILKEPDNSLIKQYKALLRTENVDLEFSEDGINTIANLATEVNSSVENIGARRLHTIIEKVLDEISFTATDRSGEKLIIDSNYVKKNLGELVKDTDLSKFIL